jgi:hypothetical protein
VGTSKIRKRVLQRLAVNLRQLKTLESKRAEDARSSSESALRVTIRAHGGQKCA